MNTFSIFLVIRHTKNIIIILLCLLLFSCSQRFYFFDSSTTRFFKFSSDELEMEIRIDIRSFDKNHQSLSWSNTIRIKIENKTKDAVILIDGISSEMIGKKEKVKGVINQPILTFLPTYIERHVDFPLIVHENETEEFYIPVTFEYNKSLGANHHIMIEINDVYVNNEKINIQPVMFSYSKIRY